MTTMKITCACGSEDGRMVQTSFKGHGYWECAKCGKRQFNDELPGLPILKGVLGSNPAPARPRRPARGSGGKAGH